jgi:hypothetical protein
MCKDKKEHIRTGLNSRSLPRRAVSNFLDLQCPALFYRLGPLGALSCLELPNGSIRVVNQPPSEAAMLVLIKMAVVVCSMLPHLLAEGPVRRP